MRVTVLAGGVGAARFLTGLREAAPDADITVIGNVADDITLHGLRVCPDLDTVMYTLGGGIHPGQGWGRDEESFAVAGELRAYGEQPDWFTLGDRDIATHIVRTRMLNRGLPLSQVTEHLCRRWRPGVRLLPVSDDRMETHVVVPQDDGSQVAVHFQEWWVRMRAAPDALRFEIVGLAGARPAPGVVESITGADAVLLAPSNPVVSVGPILGVPGVRQALRESAAGVAGLSPIVGGRAVRGMAESCLRTIGVTASAAGVLGLYEDFLDAWVVDPPDAAEAGRAGGERIRVVATPALMSDPAATRALASATLDAALAARGDRVPGG